MWPFATVILWFIRNIYIWHSDNQNIFLRYIWLHPQFLVHSSLKPWNFLVDKGNGSIFSYNTVFGLLSSVPENAADRMGILIFVTIPFHHNWVYVNRRGFWILPQGMGWLPAHVNGWFSWFQSYTLISRQEGELEVESISVGQWFSQSWLCNEASIKSSKDSFSTLCWRASTWGTQIASACYLASSQFPGGQKLLCSICRPTYLFIWL